jgi:serine/threonine-protein kinase RsbW
MCSQNQQPDYQERIVQGTRDAFDSIQQKILTLMVDAGYVDDDIFAMRISLEEGLANALLHGHQGEEDSPITVRWYCDACFVECVIVDQGRGYDPESIPDPTADENITLPSGRGLAMIRAFMDEVTVNEQGNRVTMKRFKIRPQAPENS